MSAGVRSPQQPGNGGLDLDTHRTEVRSVGVVSVSESNPEGIEGRKTRINTGFSTNARIGRSPKESEKERPEGSFWASEGGEKGVSRPKVGEAERAENEAITRQNPPLGEAGSLRQRMFR